MKYPAVLFTTIVLGVTGISQVKKPKKTEAEKPKTHVSKGQSAQTNIATSKVAKPKAVPTPKKSVKTADEKTDFDAAWGLAEPAGRIAALRTFLKDYPNSERVPVVHELLSRADFDSANSAVQGGDEINAMALFSAAIADARAPIPEKLFEEVVSKIPPALFWRGKRAEAMAAASAIEAKSSTQQLLEIAAFYISVESGSEAKRIALAVIDKEPSSAAAYQTLALSNRIDFDLPASEAAYAKALELDPASTAAKRGLAEMKRALGNSDEAVAIYREMLAADPSSIPARTGLVLSLFDAGKQPDGEAELRAALDANPGNVMLLASAAYWYDAHGDGKKGIDLAQKAIATDPRFIWSHIALAMGYMAEKQPLEAERTLLAARRYGNFPTLAFEIASARLMAGFYREAAEELAANFSIKDGVVSTKLGGRVAHESSDLADVVALERKASIAAPISGDSPDASHKLVQLLDLWLKLTSEDRNDEAIAKAADAFAAGDDGMRVHRQLFAAKELLDHKIGIEKAGQLARGALGNADTSLDVPSPEAAVMADALYDNRRLAVVRDEYIRVPDVPRQTLLNIVRGRIEDLNGRALFDAGNIPEAVTHFKRAVSVLPAGSLWWKNTTWRFGTALEADGKPSEALDAYIRSYKSGGPDLIRYSTIATLYRKLTGDISGLEEKIGPDPAATQAAKSPEPSPSPTAQSVEMAPTPSPQASPEPKLESAQQQIGETKIEPTVPRDAIASPASEKAAVPEASPAASPAGSPVISPESKVVSSAQPSPTPGMKTDAIPQTSAAPDPVPAPENLVRPVIKPGNDPPSTISPETSADETDKKTPQPSAVATPSPEITLTEPNANAVPISTPAIEQVNIQQDNVASVKTSDVSKKDLFPAVVITIPSQPPSLSPKNGTADESSTSSIDRSLGSNPSQRPSNAVAPCTVTLSEPSLTLQKGAGDLAVIVGTEDDREITDVAAQSSEPKDIAARREPIAGIKARALFVVSSISDRIGIFSVTFKLPCGQKELSVKVR